VKDQYAEFISLVSEEKESQFYDIYV